MEDSPKRRSVSAATKSKMRAAWAKRKGGVASPEAPPAATSKVATDTQPDEPAQPKTKRTMSAEGKARIAAAQRKRWAKLKRETKRGKNR